MTPLIDADILLYEIGFSSQKKVGGELEISSWEWTKDLFDKRVNLIVDEARGTNPPVLFLTNTPYISKLLNKRRKWAGEKVIEFAPNFRHDIVQEFKDEETGEVLKTKKYKDNRKSEKPFHFKNLINHVLSEYDYFVAENNIETDDAMCIWQYARVKQGHFDTIICSRDKDLKQCPGWHYSWEAYMQPSWGPFLVDDLGSIEKIDKIKVLKDGTEKVESKIKATGSFLFYYQMLTGDNVDNITGAIGKGPAFAYNLLKDATSAREMYELVGEVYVKTYGEDWTSKFREMADLLYMVRELNSDGTPKRWVRPDKLQSDNG